MRSFTIIVCLLVLLAAFIRADDDDGPRKARGKAKSSLQGFHTKLFRENFKKPIKKTENTRADETRVENIQVYKPDQALTRRAAPRLSPAKMQRLVEEKQRVLRNKKKEGKQDGSRTSSITDRLTSRDAALRQVRALHQHKVVMMEKRVLEALDQFCNLGEYHDGEQCAKMVKEYDLEGGIVLKDGNSWNIQIDKKIRSKIRNRLQVEHEDQYEKKKVEISEKFDATKRRFRKP